MGDEGGFDPCECIFNHEMAMRRLLSLLRNSQTVCNDHECTDGSVLGNGSEGGDSFVMLTLLWMVMALVLYLLRPASMRNGDAKPNNNNNNSNNEPEPPSVM